MRGLEVAVDRPALGHAECEPERVLARAVVMDAPRRAAQGARRRRVARRDGAAGEVADAQPARREDLGHPGDMLR
jgi:hypothetical protein